MAQQKRLKHIARHIIYTFEMKIEVGLFLRADRGLRTRRRKSVSRATSSELISAFLFFSETMTSAKLHFNFAFFCSFRCHRIGFDVQFRGFPVHRHMKKGQKNHASFGEICNSIIKLSVQHISVGVD